MSDQVATLSDLPMTDAERVAVRRHLGYPLYGNAVSNAGWQYFTHYGALEFRVTNLAVLECQELRRQLAILAKLEADLLASADNLDTAQAAVWTRNPAEVRERRGMLREYRQDLAAFLGVPVGPGASGAGGSCRVIV